MSVTGSVVKFSLNQIKFLNVSIKLHNKKCNPIKKLWRRKIEMCLFYLVTW